MGFELSSPGCGLTGPRPPGTEQQGREFARGLGCGMTRTGNSPPHPQMLARRAGIALMKTLSAARAPFRTALHPGGSLQLCQASLAGRHSFCKARAVSGELDRLSDLESDAASEAQSQASPFLALFDHAGHGPDHTQIRGLDVEI